MHAPEINRFAAGVSALQSADRKNPDRLVGLNEVLGEAPNDLIQESPWYRNVWPAE